MKKYKIDNNRTLVIEQSAIDELNKYQQGQQDSENGGILLGKVKKDDSEIIITNISHPSSQDQKGRFFFIRSKTAAQKTINKYWKTTNGVITYLGEWHSHPEKSPTPSLDDKNVLTESLKENFIHIDILFMIIVGNTGNLYVAMANKEDYKYTVLRQY